MRIPDLLHALLHTDYSSAVRKHGALLRGIVRITPVSTEDGDYTYIKTFDSTLRFHTEFNKSPTVSSLRQYAISLPHSNKTLGLGEATKLELDALSEQWEATLPEIDDIDILITNAAKEARQLFWARKHSVARRILDSGVKLRDGAKERVWTGPDDALQYLLDARSYDLQIGDERPQGPLHENTAIVDSHLAEMLAANGEDRLYTLIDAFDDAFLIGQKYNSYIGVLGFSNDGKTLFLNTLAYNFPKQGKNILYVSVEHSTVDLWTKMCFLHSNYYQFLPKAERFRLPSYTKFRLNQVSKEDILNFTKIERDLEARDHVPGLIDVHDDLRTWDSIVEHLNAHQERNQYDAVIIDYIAHLELPSEVKDRDKDTAYAAIFDKAQVLCRTFNKNGIVLITPLQANRRGKHLAGKMSSAEALLLGRYDMTAVHQYSKAYQAMDLVIGVYSDPDMKRVNLMDVNILKLREDNVPNPVRLDVDEDSKVVKQPASGTPAKTLQGYERPKGDFIEDLGDTI